MNDLTRRRCIQAMTAGLAAALGSTPAAAGWKAWATSIAPGVLGRYGHVRFADNGQIALPQTVVQIQRGHLVEIFAGRFVNAPMLPGSVSETHF